MRVCVVGGEDAGEDVCGRLVYDVVYVSVCLFVPKLLVLKLI